MRTRKSTKEATKESKRMHLVKSVRKTRSCSRSTNTAISSVYRAGKHEKKRDVENKIKNKLKSGVCSPVEMKKRERTPTTDKEQQIERFSPIKTRGLCKKQVRGMENCRLCKSSTGDFLPCSACQTKYHLKCLGYNLESIRLISSKRVRTWLCPQCIVCSTCNTFIFDPENVQCFACDRAFHGTCYPDDGIWTNSKDPLSNWFCPECKYLSEVENSESSESNSPTTSSCRESESWERKSSSGKTKHGCAADSAWKENLQAERDAISDHLKDLCREYLEKQKRKLMKEFKRQNERENLLPKKKTGLSARNSKKVKGIDLEHVFMKNNIIDSVKFVSRKGRDEAEQMSDVEKQRAMKEKATSFDYNLYMAAKKEFLASESREGEIDEEMSPGTQWLQFGSKRLLAMYPSPYPKRIAQSSVVYLCRFCLTALEDSTMYEIHTGQCEWEHPPGNEIYRENNLSFWEIDGIDETAYCRRLCLLSKLFLFSKTLHHEVETFLFYILTEYTAEGHVLLGYFSKEKNPSKNNNLSCLLTVPSAHRTGYGKLLIDLSYKLSLRERKIGGPEHPLSDMGLLTYRSYWRAVVISYIRKKRPSGDISIKDMSYETGIHSSDLISTLLENKMLKYRDGNYLINKKKAFTAPLHTFRRRVIHDEKLVWEPEFDIDNKCRMGTYV